VMLLGLATKNSILLVDRTNQLLIEGWEMYDAIIEAGRNRLRPILMTSFALIAGMLPVAIGLNEASKQRTSMGVGIIGGLITSTLLTLVVIPAAFTYIERTRRWFLRKLRVSVGLPPIDNSIAEIESLEAEHLASKHGKINGHSSMPGRTTERTPSDDSHRAQKVGINPLSR
jgi:predicted RND superfamily exporter protein